MKIAVVVPYVMKVEGNRVAFLIARDLARRHDVTLFAHTVVRGVVEDVRRIINQAEFKYINDVGRGQYGIKFALEFQFLRRKTHQLSKFMKKSGEFDHVIVIANEGHWLPLYFKDHKRTKFHLLVMELHDHGIVSLMNSHADARMVTGVLASPFYGIFKLFERRRFLSFNKIYSNSTWTKTLFEYLYGIPVSDVLFTIDTEFFTLPDTFDNDERFIAVPTVSLKNDPVGQKVIRRLISENVNIKCYGPMRIDGAENLGYLSDTDMVKVLGKASATLFLFNYEALGLVPFESLSCGTPVITYDKQGPGLELKDNPNVTFAKSYDEIYRSCEHFLSQDKDLGYARKCRESVMKYESTNVADILETHLTRQDSDL